MYLRRFCMQPRNNVLQGQASASLGWTLPFLTYPPSPHLPHLQRFIWFNSRGHIVHHNAQREHIIERKMKAKRSLGGMILSWSDNRARSPARPPRAEAETFSSRHLLILPVLQLKAMKCTMICFFFYKDWWALCFVWFGLLVCIYITHYKKEQNRKHNKNIFVGRKC